MEDMALPLHSEAPHLLPGVSFEPIFSPRVSVLARAARRGTNRLEQFARDSLMAGVISAESRGPAAFAAAIDRARALNLRFDRDILPRVAAAAVPIPPPSGAPAAFGTSEWFRPKDHDAPVGLVFHVHGGGFICTRSPRVNKLVARFAAAAGAAVYAPSYRLAPEHPAPAAAEDVAEALRWAHARFPGEPIIALAESAGAAVLLAALQALRDAGEQLPVAIVLLSPFVDLTLQSLSVITASLTGGSTFTMASMALAARFYRGSLPATDPRVSPLFGSFERFPPMLIHTSKGDILHDDTLNLAERVREARGTLSVRVWEDEGHAWERMNGPQARRSIELAADFMRRHFGSVR
jgi:acetyl esterase/lipase